MGDRGSKYHKNVPKSSTLGTYTAMPRKKKANNKFATSAVLEQVLREKVLGSGGTIVEVKLIS